MVPQPYGNPSTTRVKPDGLEPKTQLTRLSPEINSHKGPPPCHSHEIGDDRMSLLSLVATWSQTNALFVNMIPLLRARHPHAETSRPLAATFKFLGVLGVDRSSRRMVKSLNLALVGEA